MYTIAIIEDDIHINEIVNNALLKENYQTIRAYSGTEALLLLEKKRPDLILLDLMLPGLSGEEILPKLKGIPTIVVSAKIGIDDKVDLLLKGAVDYITKPFEIKELLARITVHLRKRDVDLEVLSFKEITLNTVTYSVHIFDKEIKLTKSEFAILKTLMKNPNQVISKSLILERIVDDTEDCTDSSLKQHIFNLRKKIADANGNDYIESIWGIGYMLK